MTVAVVGLGDLGVACALRLHEIGLEPIGVEASEERRAAWQRETGRQAISELSGVAVDHALVCVRSTAQACEVLRELRDCAAGRELAAYVVTTLEPAFARELGAHAGNGMRVIELPVSGGRTAARRGELTVLIGGDQARGGDVKFIERTLARRTFAFTRFGGATLAKLLNNAVAAYNAAAFAACLALAERAELDVALCADVIRAGSGSSWIAEHFDALVDELLAKDAGLLAAELGELPAIELSDGERLVATLSRVRGLLA